MNLKSRAFAIHAVHADKATHHINQLLGQIQAKSRPFDIAVSFLVKADKVPEQFFTVPFANTDASILHLNKEVHSTGIVPLHRVNIDFLCPNGKRDRPFVRVLDRIRKQVVYHLPNADFVAEQRSWNIRRDIHLHFQILVVSAESHHIVAVVQHRKHAIRNRQNFHLARFDFRYIQNIVNERKQRLACTLNIQGVITQAFIFAFLQEHRIHAQDSINRRTDFMAHVGKKNTLRLACAFGIFFFAKQLLVFAGFLFRKHHIEHGNCKHEYQKAKDPDNQE